MKEWKLKYRIKEFHFPFADTLYAAQYKVFGLWMYVNYAGIGRFALRKGCECNSYEEAFLRAKNHNNGMLRAGDWWIKQTVIHSLTQEELNR